MVSKIILVLFIIDHILGYTSCYDKCNIEYPTQEDVEILRKCKNDCDDKERKDRETIGIFFGSIFGPIFICICIIVIVVCYSAKKDNDKSPEMTYTSVTHYPLQPPAQQLSQSQISSQ